MVRAIIFIPQLKVGLLTLTDRRWVSRSSGGFIDTVNNMLFPGYFGGQQACREPAQHAEAETFVITAPELSPDSHGRPSPFAR